jgi:hypothetical protein
MVVKKGSRDPLEIVIELHETNDSWRYTDTVTEADIAFVI